MKHLSDSKSFDKNTNVNFHLKKFQKISSKKGPLGSGLLLLHWQPAEVVDRKKRTI
jgi:hypothetical protein